MQLCGNGCSRLQQRREFLKQLLLYLGHESNDCGGCLHTPGFNEEATLALEKVQPEADCKTCCLEGMMAGLNFVRKSMPSNGVATTANKKSTQNFVLRNRQKFGESFAVVSHQVFCGSVRKERQ
jgi:hypothetical protein